MVITLFRLPCVDRFAEDIAIIDDVDNRVSESPPHSILSGLPVEQRKPSLRPYGWTEYEQFPIKNCLR